MGYPTKNVISRGARLKGQLLSVNGSRPAQYTVTLGAAATAGANQLSLTSSATVDLQHNEVLRFPKAGDAWLVNNAAGYQAKANGIIIDGTGADPQVGDVLRFGNHATVYTVASYTNNVLGLNPTLRQAVGDNEVVETLVEAVINLPQTSTLNDVVRLGTAATAVEVTPIKYGIDANATTISYALRTLLGLSDASPTEAPQTVDATDHESALEGLQKTVTTIYSKTVTANGNRIENDRFFTDVAIPIFNDRDNIGRSVWIEVNSSDGSFRTGIAQITDSSATDTVQQLEGYNFTFTFIADYDYVSGDDVLYTVAA